MVGLRSSRALLAAAGLAATLVACSNVAPSAGTGPQSASASGETAPESAPPAAAAKPQRTPANGDRIALTPANYEKILTGTMCAAVGGVAPKDFRGAVVGRFPGAGLTAVDLRPATIFEVVFAVATDPRAAPGALPSKAALITDRVEELCTADVKAFLDGSRSFLIANSNAVNAQATSLGLRLEPKASPEFERFLAALDTADKAARDEAIINLLRDEKASAAITEMTQALEDYGADVLRGTMVRLVGQASLFTLRNAKAMSEDAANFRANNAEAVMNNARDLTLYRAYAYDWAPEARLYVAAGLEALITGARSGKSAAALGTELETVDAIKERVNRQIVFVRLRVEALNKIKTSSLGEDLLPLPPEGLGLLDGEVTIDLAAFGASTMLAQAD